MNKYQQALLAVFGVQLTTILVLFHVLEGQYHVLGIVKYMVITSISFSSFFLKGRTDHHFFLSYSFVFLWVGDFFLILVGTFPNVSPEYLWVRVGGMVGFLLGYICLIFTYWKGKKKPFYSIGKRDLLMSIPVILVATPCVIILVPLASGLMRIWSLFFTFALGYMSWQSICTIHGGVYKKIVSYRFALAGFLIFLSDMGIGFSFFYPGLHRNVPWLGFEIWITYIPAWVLLLLNVSEKKLTVEESKDEKEF